MNLRSFLFLSFFVAAGSQLSAKVERLIEHTYPQGSVKRLHIEAEGSPIEIESRTTGGIDVTVTEIVRGSEADAARLRKDIRIEFQQKGDTAQVKVAGPKGMSSWFGNTVKFRIRAQVPRSLHLDIQTSGGSIKVGTMDGDVVLRTSGGGIDTAVMNGKVKANTSGGSIHIGGAAGELHANTSGGRISVGQTKAPARLETSGGSITVEAAQSSVSADTSGGGINVTYVGALVGENKLGTSGGGIDVRVDSNASFDLVAKTSGGSVKVDLPLNGEKSSSKAVGKVGEGGPKLSLNTSGGSIRVKTR